HDNPQMADHDIGFINATMPRAGVGRMGFRVLSKVLQPLPPIPRRSPDRQTSGQFGNPGINRIQPIGGRSLLHISHHGRQGKAGAMPSEFEPLNAAARPVNADDILPFPAPFRRRQPLGLENGDRRLGKVVGRSVWHGGEVNGSTTAGGGLVKKKKRLIAMPRLVIQVFRQTFSQFVFAFSGGALGVIPPNREMPVYEINRTFRGFYGRTV
ncbi:MAG: hypothetical protein LBU64_15045, partial [Planctomycetota bacterium]|nr:hypothetical protein [Planctomycetota bacterium]